MSFTDDELLAAGRAALQEPVVENNLKAFAGYEAATPPKKFADNLSMAQRTGIPVASVPEHEAQIKAQEHQQALVDLQITAPKTARWLAQDPGNVALFRDAIPIARELEDIVSNRPVGIDIPRVLTGLQVAAGGLIPRTAGGLMGLQRAAAENVFEPPANLLRRALGQEPATPISDYFKGKQQYWDTLATELTKTAEQELLAGGVSPSVSSGVASGAQMVGQVAVALLAPESALPTMVGSVVGQEYGAARDTLSPARALLYGTGQGVIEYGTEKFALSKFLDAVKAGRPLTKAAAEMALKEIPGEQLATFFQDLQHATVLTPEKPISDFWEERPNAALQTLVATLVGGGSTMTVAATVDALHGAFVREPQSRSEAEQELADRKRKAFVAEDANTRLAAMFEIANEHPLRAIHSEKFNEFVSNLTEDSDITEIYVNANTLAEVLANNGVDMQALQTQLPAVAAQLTDGSILRQGDVVISVPDLLTHITNPKLQEALLPHLKTTPEGFTYEQSQVFYQEETALLEKRATEIALENQPVMTREEFLTEQENPESPYAKPVDSGVEGVVPTAPTYEEYVAQHKNQIEVRAREINTLRSEIAAEMKNMKAFPSHVVAAYATPLTEFYATHAAKMGVTVSELRNLLPLKFTAGQMTGYQQPSANYGAQKRAAQRVATLDSFKSDQVGDLLRKTDWAILTAENPAAERGMSAEENAARNAELEADLKAMGITYSPMVGMYGKIPENSFALVGVTREQAAAIGAKYGQQSVLTRDGFVYEDGRVNPAVGMTTDFTNGYSVMPDGTKFAIGLKYAWDAPRESMPMIGETRLGEVERTGVHYSLVPRTVLEGSMYGTGTLGRERARIVAGDVTSRRISFYTDEGQGVRPEPGVGAFRHEALVANVYDMYNDPLGLYELKETDHNGIAQPLPPSVVERMLLAAGFDGVYNSHATEGGDGHRQGRIDLIGQATEKFEVDTPPKQDVSKEYAQAINEIAEHEPPSGKLAPQDLADLRKLWAMYAMGDTATLYGRSTAKAEELVGPAVLENVRQILDAVFPEGVVPPTVKDVTRFREGLTSQVTPGVVALEFFSGGRRAEAYINTLDKTLQLNIMGWGEGGHGSAVYKTLLEFAKNNGFVFFGDVQGISVGGIKRRLENLLSHAIQSGDTSYMRLHPKQLSFIEQETGIALKWEIGNHKNNVEQMLNASYNLANLDIPELKNVYFDFTQKQYVDTGSGGTVADIARHIAKARRNVDPVRREGSAGLATARRTVFSNTLLRAKTPEARRIVFVELARLGVDGLPGARQLLYQSEAAGKPPFYSALTRAFEETKLAKAAPDQWLGTLNSLTQKGVKPMEIEYTGLKEWLEARKTAPDSWHTYQDGVVISTRPATDPKPEGDVRLHQPSKVVTKEEIVEFLREHAITIEPRVYGGGGEAVSLDVQSAEWQTEEPDDYYMQERAEESVQEADEEALVDLGLDEEEAAQLFAGLNAGERAPYQNVKDVRESELAGLYDKAVEAQIEKEIQRYWDDSESPQYRNISVEAGDETYDFNHYYSYGEYQLTDDRGREVDIAARRVDDAVVEQAIRQHLEEYYNVVDAGGTSTKFENYTLDGGENYHERLLLNPSHTGKDFTYTSHFDDENIIGFSRVDDRTVPVANIEAEFPELAARLRAEGRATAKVYFLEEVQSDWAQQGRERPEVNVPYTREELSVDMVASAGAPELLASVKVSPLSIAPQGGMYTRDEGNLRNDSTIEPMTVWFVHTVDNLNAYPSAVYASKDAAESERLRLAEADSWVVKAPDQVFNILKSKAATPEDAVAYIVKEKTHTVKGTMTAFDAAREEARLNKLIDTLHSEQWKLLSRGLPDEEQIAAIKAKLEVLTGQLDALPREKISPSAFVESTDAWVGLVLKDAIHQAAEGGFDLVSWTTGTQQTQRWSYGLRKKVDTIGWEKSADGKIHIIAMQGQSEKANTHYGENDLAAAIGKTMAQRIIEDPNQKGEIKGNDIVVADLGMTKFYGDEHGLNPEGKPAIITKVANQILKKLGGGAVTGVELHKRDKFGHAEEKDYRDANFSNQPAFEITQPVRDMALEGQVLMQKQRGSFNPDTMVMSLMKGADLSTVLHESGHFYLEALRTLAAHPNATEQVKDDWQKTLNWFGIQDTATWNALSFEEKRPLHEQWAQSQERWMFEGNAPSLEMQPVFARFRSWLLQVYKSLEQFLQQNPLAGKLNDEVRGVFSRLIASEELIAQAEQARGYTKLLPHEGLDNAAFKEYMALGQEATQEAVTDVQRRSLRDMRWLSNAKDKALKKLQKQAADLRKQVKEDVTKEVMSEPINMARTFLTKGETTDPTSGDSIKVTEGFRLNTAMLAEMYPATMLSRPDLTKLRGMVSKDGLSPDIVAQTFGFRSGDDLVRSLIEQENPKDKIDGLTDQRMLEQHGELVDQDAVERAAEAAIHNEARSRFLATGLQMLTKSVVPVRDIVKAAKDVAKRTLSRKKVKDIQPHQYEAAEAKANKEAIVQASKDPTKAIEAQRAALLNNQLAKAAVESLEDVEKAIRYLDKFKNEGTRKKLDIEYLEQIDDLLANLDTRKGQSLKAIDKRRTLAEWIKRQEDMGFEPVIDTALLEDLKRKHYKEMTIEEVLGLIDSVKQIEHLGRLKKKLLTAKDAREFAERIAEAVASIEANATRTVKERATPSDVVGKLGKLARQFSAAHRKFASILREMDGSQDGGVMWELLLRGMNEAGDTETRMKGEAAERVAALFKPIMAKMGGFAGHIYTKRIQVPGSKLQMTYEERVMFALNWGNEGNRQRLLSGGLSGQRGITETDGQAVLDSLDREDLRFVQGVWDYLDTFRPLVAEQERRLTGKEPKWIEAVSFETKFGRMRGGYFPAKYDAALSTRSESLEAATNLRLGMQGAFNAAATRNGYTQARSEEVKNRPMLLSFNAISQHVNEVAHRLSWQDWLVDANRSVKALDGTIRDHYGVEILTEMRDTIKDIALGDAPATTPVEAVINHLRVGSTIVGLGWRVTTALLQPSGLAQSWVRVGGPWVARGLKQYMANPMKASEFVNEKSSLMRDRGKTMMREVNEVLNVVRAGETVSALQASAFYMIGKMQRTVDIPTWLGAYEKALAQLELEKAGDEAARKAIDEKAVAMAEQAVIDAQSGGQLKDLAKVQRGTPVLKLFTNFYSYFSATYNLNVESYRRTSFKSPTEIGIFAADMLILNTLPVVFSLALKEALKGGCTDGDLECLAGRLAHEQLGFLLGQMVLLREASAGVEAATGGDAYGYKGPAGLRFFSDLYNVGQQVGQGEADLALVKSVNSVAGALLHYPAGQINSTLEGILEIESGRVEGTGVLPALLAGKPRKE